jgi:hypothetical protein
MSNIPKGYNAEGKYTGAEDIGMGLELSDCDDFELEDIETE